MGREHWVTDLFFVLLGDGDATRVVESASALVDVLFDCDEGGHKLG